MCEPWWLADMELVAGKDTELLTCLVFPPLPVPPLSKEGFGEGAIKFPSRGGAEACASADVVAISRYLQTLLPKLLAK